jgi:cytochrome c oxidase cbb3-type subunit 3
MRAYWGGLLAALSVLCAEPGAQAQMARWRIDEDAAARGEKDFVATCAFCHGSDARGSQRAPDLVQSELVNQDEKGELIQQLLAKGRPDKGMPAFPQLVDHASDIAAFLHSRISNAANRFTYKIQPGSSGDAKAGEQYFNGAGGCTACHSPTGDLVHVAGKYKPDELEGAIAFPGPTVLYYVGLKMRPISKPEVTVTVTLPGGKTVSGPLVYANEYDVALRDGDGNFRSFARTPDLKVEIHDPLDGHRKALVKMTDADLHNLLAYLLELK